MLTNQRSRVLCLIVLMFFLGVVNAVSANEELLAAAPVESQSVNVAQIFSSDITYRIATFETSINSEMKNSQSAACAACIRQWCEFECAGYGDGCARCMITWCDYEC